MRHSQAHDSVPGPAFATRGVMLDVSRNRVPTMAELRRVVDLIAAHGGNHLQLYTEHTFAYEGHEDVWRGWSPMTPAEVRELDAYADARGVELVANQNCFGHLAHWLRLPAYQHLAETHGDWMFDVWPRSGPFSLCPTDPSSLAFVRDLLSRLLPCFRSRLVNIGCDETYDVGFGRSREEVERRGRAAVYAEFVGKVCGVVRELGSRPMFWADIALHDESALRMLPSEAIALAWGYEPDAPFARWCDAVRGAGEGREVWVCPGTSTWRSITGRTSERRANIAAAARDGLAHGATGFLLCDWGDTGHHQQWPVVEHAIAEGLRAAWTGGRDVPSPIGPPREPALASWLDELGDADLHLRETCGRLARPELTGPQRLRNQSALFIDLHNHPHDRLTDVAAPPDWERALTTLESLDSRRPRTGDAQIDAELAHTTAYAIAAARRGFLRRRPGGLTRADKRDLIARFSAIAAEHARLWRLRSREGGLSASLAHFEKVIADLSR